MYSGYNNNRSQNQAGSQNNSLNEPIFVEHSHYMLRTVGQAKENRQNPQLFYDRAQTNSSFHTQNYNNFERSTSEYNPYNREHRPLPNSISHDSYFAEHLDKQGKYFDKLLYAIKASKEALADVEHTMLEKEDELRKLNCIQKNPSKQDLKKIQNEVNELQRSVQNLCHEMDKTNTTQTPATPPSHVSSPNTRLYNSYLDFARPRQRSYDPVPLESPTTRLLRNPIDNSLVFSQEKY